MSLYRFFAAISLAALLHTSCSEAGHDNARSTHIDSSNVNGTAPVRYGPEDPADTLSQLPPGDDTGKRANTSRKDE